MFIDATLYPSLLAINPEVTPRILNIFLRAEDYSDGNEAYMRSHVQAAEEIEEPVKLRKVTRIMNSYEQVASSTRASHPRKERKTQPISKQHRIKKVSETLGSFE